MTDNIVDIIRRRDAHEYFVETAKRLVDAYGGPNQWEAFVALRAALAEVDAAA